MFKKDYIELYLKNDEQFFEFNYEKEGNYFYNISIKRPIKKVGFNEIKEELFDLESAYGYGGYLSNGDEKFIKEALKRYKEYCQDQNIIAEFIRFHPFNDFPKKLLDFNLIERKVVVKNLEDDIMGSFNSKTRYYIKRALRDVKIEKSNNIEKFLELYYFTMNKNNASDFYYFDKKYFEKLINLPEVELYACIYKNEIIAMSFFIFSRYGYYHLSANSEISYKLGANYALLYYGFEEAKNKGIKYFVLGGGTTYSETDSLFKFKKKFSNIIMPFYIGGMIFDKSKYRYLNILWDEQFKQDIKYFLKYRLEK
jgi:hypothetical protein